LGDSRLHMLPVIKGLVSEAERVRAVFKEIKPEALAASISREELAGLRAVSGEEEYEMSDIEWYYAQHLSRFGEVRLPPPCFLTAQQLADGEEIPIIPLDMNEDLYSAAYCTTVGTLDILRESFMVRRMKKIRFDLSSAEDFVIDWDSRVNRSKGFRGLQKEREEHMTKILARLARKYDTILAVIELERAEGIGDRLLRWPIEEPRRSPCPSEGGEEEARESEDRAGQE
jgi:hypothetical protein